ncbi:terminase [Mycobacterium phage Paola]|uniref:Terminase n=2 Tax=Kratiovirus TaxID=2948788 RepID=A0A1C9EGP5_9CAUD|nr:terminase small subunit [Mycobacterium phage Gengar]YP_009950812.1 terminase [Mycobacterium phage Paola]ASR85795.1 terminase [Mycobacterium phage Guillsminger]QXN73749.1 terminase [Mycobacterium phage SoSeph]WNM65476.1 terminase [Mycobacterium phage Heftyboy]AON96661.1 terminase [Mycobacterium phage Gengar]AVO25797.1 terminase [Mycobacterium phage Paola]
MSNPRLSEVARHVIKPEGIVSTSWPAVRHECNVNMRLFFDQWQDDLGKLVCAKRSDGLFAADMFAMSVPRQTGKTYFLGALVFALCKMNAGTTVIWTAHRTRTAAETFKSMQALSLREEIAPHIEQVLTGNGKEAVLFTNGSRILFGAREKGFGRGFAKVDVLIFDEAQILTENAMDDMVPATNASPNALILLAGTPPKPTDPGEVFTNLRLEAINGESTDVGYVEISADEDAEPDDVTQYPKMNPSYPHRTSLRSIQRMRKALSWDSFRREAMGIWDKVSVHAQVIKPARWREMADELGPDPGIKPNALGVDMSHGRQISIGACWNLSDGEDDEWRHIEQVWAGADTDAAIEWIVERAGRRMPVIIDGASPAAALAPELKARKVKVRITSAGDMAKACGLVVAGADGDTLTHGDQEDVSKALTGAKKRAIRDAGGWGWDRRDPESIIHPLVAVTLALLGAVDAPRKSSGGAMFA